MITVLATAALLATSTPVGFTDDYDAALAQAKAEKKLIVADFSGSDWCFWCQRLDKEVFSQEAFVSVATNKYVLLMIDNPSDRSRLSEKARSQNAALAKKYRIQGFPTVLLLDGDGKIQAETGFVGGGPENYLKHLEEKVAAIPFFTAYIKPLDRRISSFYKRYYDEMSAAMKTVQGKSKEEVAACERETTLRLVAELDAIIAEERAREVPSEVVSERAARLDQAEAGANKLRDFAASR